jgi:hypothetical protein
VSGQTDIITDYATTRRREEPITTAITENTEQGMLHRRMNTQPQMRWSRRCGRLMQKVRTSAAKGTPERDYAITERCAPFRRAA